MGENQNPGDGENVLSNRRRRLVVGQLQSHESMTLRDLAEQIAVTDQRTEIESLSEEAVQEVEVALHHVHAPKLAEAGYVEYNARQQLIGITDSGRGLHVDAECDEHSVERTDSITVDLCLDTVDELHELIRRDDRLDARMSYDEVISVALSDAGVAGEPLGDGEEAR